MHRKVPGTSKWPRDTWCMDERASPFGTEPDLRTKNPLFCGVKCILVRSLFLSSALSKSTFIFSVHSQEFLFWWKCSVGLLAVCGLPVYFFQYKSPFPMRDSATSLVSWWWRLTTDLDWVWWPQPLSCWLGGSLNLVQWLGWILNLLVSFFMYSNFLVWHLTKIHLTVLLHLKVKRLVRICACTLVYM